MLKAVIFDMDGVIVDSEPLHAEAAKITMEDYDIQLPVSYFLNFVGSTTRHMYDVIIDEYKLSVTADELLEKNKFYCKKLYEERGRIPVEGAIDLIKTLAASGLKLAIASSSTPEQIKVVVDEFGLTDYFSCLASGAALGKPKPNPDVFLEALRLLEVNADEAIVIEDSTNGVLAANNASIACVGFLNPHSGKQDLYSAAVATDSLSALTPDYLSQVLDRFNGVPLTIGQTPRLILRELTLEDMKDLYQIYQNKEICQYIPPMDTLEEELEKHAAYIQNVYPFYGYGLWGIFTSKDNILIGRAGIQNQTIDGQDELELCYLIANEYQNHGYATEAGRKIIDFAIEELDAPRLVAVIAKGNAASCQVAKKLGMSYEKEVTYQGFDCYFYSIDLKEEKRRRLTTKGVIHSVKPDTRVYSKRYS